MVTECKPQLSIQLLGRFAVYDENGGAYLGHSSRLQSLLAYLLLHHDTPLSREGLAFIFWPNTSEAKARSSLRSLLYRLRKELPTDHFLRIDSHNVQWQMTAACSLDVARFEQAMAQAHTAVAVQAALDRYTGDLLPECYEDWIFTERERLRQRYLDGLDRLVTLYEGQGDYDAALVAAQRLLLAEPLQEEGYRRLMRLHALRQDRNGVEQVWQACVEAMANELDLPPSPALAKSYHRFLKIATDERPRHNLPTQSTPFVGRETEVDQIIHRLADPHCRLLTLTGPGGIGKTRLALQVAQNLTVDFFDGAVFVSLVGLASADYLATAIAEAAAIQLQGHRSPEAQLLRHLQKQEMLLVLDNYEHLLPETRLVEQILAEAPHIKILVTSRERLNLRWEWLYALSGLPVPGQDNEREDGTAAVQLFVQTARRLRPDFIPDNHRTLIGRICHLVEGMPLGIELAAAWVRLLPCEQIAQQLAQGLHLLASTHCDLPDRHRSLRAVFDHSWKMLTPREQSVFARLSVFRGGFTPEAAEQVTGASLAMLVSLLDKSLLRRSQDGRYDLHELVRQYSAERLATDQEEQVDAFNRHCAYYAGLVKQLEVQAAATARFMQNMGEENDNIRAAWTWAVEQRRLKELGQLASGFDLFYDLRGWRTLASKMVRGSV